MATVAELERLEALVARLVPLAAKQRGELIEAGDWNGVVGALIEVARAVLGDNRVEAVPDHEHNDQVTAGWLDARLRAQVLGGGLTDPAAVAAVGKLERRLGHLGDQLAGLTQGVDRVRTDVGEISTRDLAREADITRVGRRVDGIGDARLDVADLRETLRSLEVDVGRAVEVGQQLEVGGQTVDIAGLVSRVEAVEELRDRLTGADGTLLDAAAFDRRLAELRTTLVTEQELTDALAGVRVRLPDADRAALLEAARVSAAEVAGTSVRAAAAELRGEINQRLSTVGDVVSAAVATAVGGLSEDLLARARTDIGTAVSASGQALRAELSASFDTRLARVETAVGQRVDRLAAEVGDRVAAAVASQIPAGLAPLDARIAGLGDRVVSAERVAAAADARATESATRIEEVRREGAADRARLGVELGRRIDTIESGQGRRITDAVTDAATSLRTGIRADLDTARRDIETALTETARQTAATEVRLLATQVRGDVRGMVADELTVARSDLQTSLDARFEASSNRVVGLVADEVRRATGGLQRLVREEVDALRPELVRTLDERIDRRFGGGGGGLRPPPPAPPIAGPG